MLSAGIRPMDDLQAIWPGWRPICWGTIIYFGLVRDPLGRWLQQGFLRQGRLAEARRGLYNRLLKLRLVPGIVLPAIDVAKLTNKPLPQGFAVRVYQPEDFEVCLEIYRLNAPGRFPPEVVRECEVTLQKADGSMLVIEKSGRVVACGGASLTDGMGGLYYGLIHPDFQRQGLGRLLLLARLARFQCPPVAISIHAVEASVGYYERYGFKRYVCWYSEDGAAHPTAGVSLHPENREKVAVFLEAQGYPLLPILNG